MKMNDSDVVDDLFKELKSLSTRNLEYIEKFTCLDGDGEDRIKLKEPIPIDGFYGGWARMSNKIDEARQKLDQHYASIREEAVIKARIDELKHISPTAYYYDGTGDYELVSDREKRLSDQLKASKEKK